MDPIEREKLTAMIRKILEKYTAIEVVEVSVFSSRGSTTARVIVDYPEGGIMLANCADINRDIAALAEKEFPDESISVEVSSPGLDRLLSTERDFARSKGKRVGVWLKQPAAQTYTEGNCLDVKDASLILEHKGIPVTIPLENILKGKQLVQWR